MLSAILVIFRHTKPVLELERDFDGSNPYERTSDGGNGNHSVSLPIILMKIKVYQMLPYSYIRSLLGLYFMILHLISYFHECTALF